MNEDELVECIKFYEAQLIWLRAKLKELKGEE